MSFHWSQSFDNNIIFLETKILNKLEEKIRVRKLTPHKSDKQSTDCDVSDLSIKESSLAPSYSASSESKIRSDTGTGNRESKLLSNGRKPGFNRSHRSYCCRSSRGMYCDCTFRDYHSDHSESRKRVRSKRHRKSQKYSSDSETISISRDYCCGRCFTERYIPRTRMKRAILCPSCQMEFRRDKESKNDSAAMKKTPLDREQEKERESINPASNTKNIEYEYEEKLSQCTKSSRDSEIRQDHLRNCSQSSKSSSSTTTTRSERQIVSVSTPDLSDAESVFIGSSSSDSERKTTVTCKSCNRASSPLSDNITDAPFLKIALALEKFLER